MNRFALIIAILFTALIIYLGVAEAEKITITNFQINDKLVHMLIYALFYFLWHNPFVYFFNDNSLVYLFVFTLIFSSSIEIAQKYLTLTRSAEFVDIFFNIIGIVLAHTYFKLKKRNI